MRWNRRRKVLRKYVTGGIQEDDAKKTRERRILGREEGDDCVGEEEANQVSGRKGVRKSVREGRWVREGGRDPAE